MLAYCMLDCPQPSVVCVNMAQCVAAILNQMFDGKMLLSPKYLKINVCSPCGQ